MSDKAQIEPFNYQKSTNIDEHRQIVEKTNEIIQVINDVDLDEINTKLADLTGKVETNTSDIDANTASIANLDTKLTTDETQITTNKTNIESLRDANLIITKEIGDIKEVDKDQNTQIATLGNADIATATSAFDNTARKLTIELATKAGDAITTEAIIPASGESGDEYTATAPIAIANKDISLAIDTDTMEITTDGKLKSKASGTDYTAGTGITISNNEIAVDTSEIATTAVTTELASGISTNRNFINGTFDDVNISGTHLVFDKVNGEQKEIEIPNSGSEWVLTDKPFEQFFDGPTYGTIDYTSTEDLLICFYYSGVKTTCLIPKGTNIIANTTFFGSTGHYVGTNTGTILMYTFRLSLTAAKGTQCGYTNIEFTKSAIPTYSYGSLSQITEISASTYVNKGYSIYIKSSS